MNNNQEPQRFSARQCAELGIPYNGVPSVEEVLRDDLGLGVPIPEYYIRKFQELAGAEPLDAQDVARLFNGYLSLAEAPMVQKQIDVLLKNVVNSYLEFKRTHA